MIDRRTGSARSVGPRRIRKSYLLNDGSTLMARSAAGARIDAARQGLVVIGLGLAVPKAAPDAPARVIDTDKVTVKIQSKSKVRAKKKVGRKKRKS